MFIYIWNYCEIIYIYITQESVCDVPWEVMNNNAMQSILETRDTNVLIILCVFRSNIKQVWNIQLHMKKSMLCNEGLDCAVWPFEEQTLKICLFASLRTSSWTSEFVPHHWYYNKALNIKYILKHLYIPSITQVQYEEPS